MNKHISLLLLIAFLCFDTFPAAGQEAVDIKDLIDDDEDIAVKDMTRINRKIEISDTLKGWDLEWVSGLNGSQASYDNWSQGGVNTISVSASTVFSAKYRKDKFAYALNTNFKYGQARLQGEGMRKTDDRIAVNNKFSYLFDDERWSAFGNINFSTQFDQGFNYSEDPPEVISSFFAPAYFTQIAGISFQPEDYFTAEAGLALKETIVSDPDLSTRYGLEQGETFRFEPGYSLGLNFEKKIVSNIRLVSTLETFTNLQRHIDNTDVNFSNEMVGKVNDHVDMSFQFVMVYDTDFSRELQIKQVLAAGLSYSIF